MLLTFMAAALAMSEPAAADTCAALTGLKIEPAAIGLPTQGAEATSAATDAGGVCVVQGRIAPVDPKAPDIRFQINLPKDWNGKAVHLGGGGYDGMLVDGRHPGFLPPGRDPLSRGFATFGSDSGHQGGGGNPMAAAGDASFALNQEALVNFGGAQLKKTHDVALVVIERFYGRAPKRTYFYGASQGGHEGLIVAQRYPADYDGVVSIHPAYDFTALQLSGAALGQQLYGPQGAWLSPAKTAALAKAVLQACDGLDGVNDGLVSAPAQCRKVFDVRKLRCPSGGDEGPACLSDAEIRTAVALASPIEYGVDLSGVHSFGRWPVLEGALGPDAFFGLGVRPVAGKPPTFQDAFGWLMADQGIRYMFVGDPAYDSLQFKPSEHVATLQRVSAIVDASSPDLDAFKAHGGKLLLMHGTVDMAIPPSNSEAYFGRLQARYGQNLSGFVRFYEAPGFGHGDGPFRVVWDSLDTLDRWVDEGQAPGPQTIADSNPAHAGRTRPLCEFPAWPRYKGQGDPNAGESFVCAMN